MASFTVIVRLLSGDLLEVPLSEGARCADMKELLRTHLEIPFETEVDLYLEEKLEEDGLISKDETYSLLIRPIEWRILFPQMLHFNRHTRSAVCYFSFKDKTITVLDNTPLENHSDIRYLYDLDEFEKLMNRLDVTSSWQITKKDVECFIKGFMESSDLSLEPSTSQPYLHQRYLRRIHKK